MSKLMRAHGHKLRLCEAVKDEDAVLEFPAIALLAAREAHDVARVVHRWGTAVLSEELVLVHECEEDVLVGQRAPRREEGREFTAHLGEDSLGFALVVDEFPPITLAVGAAVGKRVRVSRIERPAATLAARVRLGARFAGPVLGLTQFVRGLVSQRTEQPA